MGLLYYQLNLECIMNTDKCALFEIRDYAYKTTVAISAALFIICKVLMLIFTVIYSRLSNIHNKFPQRD